MAAVDGGHAQRLSGDVRQLLSPSERDVLNGLKLVEGKSVRVRAAVCSLIRPDRRSVHVRRSRDAAEHQPADAMSYPVLRRDSWASSVVARGEDDEIANAQTREICGRRRKAPDAAARGQRAGSPRTRFLRRSGTHSVWSDAVLGRRGGWFVLDVAVVGDEDGFQITEDFVVRRKVSALVELVRDDAVLVVPSRGLRSCEGQRQSRAGNRRPRAQGTAGAPQTRLTPGGRPSRRDLACLARSPPGQALGRRLTGPRETGAPDRRRFASSSSLAHRETRSRGCVTSFPVRPTTVPRPSDARRREARCQTRR